LAIWDVPHGEKAMTWLDETNAVAKADAQDNWKVVFLAVTADDNAHRRLGWAGIVSPAWPWRLRTPSNPVVGGRPSGFVK
jgi:hypothetical protein